MNLLLLLLSDWKNAVMATLGVALLASLLGMGFYRERFKMAQAKAERIQVQAETWEAKAEKVQADNRNLVRTLEDQDKAIQIWQDTAKEQEAKTQQAIKSAQFVEDGMRKMIQSMKSNPPPPDCEGAMAWLRAQAQPLSSWQPQLP